MMLAATDSDSFVSTSEAAQMLGGGSTRVKRWAYSGELACLRTGGGHRRFRRADVLALAAGPPEESEGPDSVGSDPSGWVELLLGARPLHGVYQALLAEREARGSWRAVAAALDPTIVELGERWAAGAITALEGHVASERLARCLARAAELIYVKPSAPWALLDRLSGGDPWH